MSDDTPVRADTLLSDGEQIRSPGIRSSPPTRRPNTALTPADESELAAWQARTVPQPTRIGPDLSVIPVPAPRLAVGYTLCYVIQDDDGVRLIDPGLGTPAGWEALTRGLQELGSDVTQVRGVIATHAHPDHTGLIGRVREASDAWFALGEAEPLPPASQNDEHIVQDDGLLATWGVPAEQRPGLNVYRFAIPSAGLGNPNVTLADGDEVPGGGLVTVSSPGHTNGHICLRTKDGSFLFTGDHVLPRIVPHVSVALDSGTDPLGAYRESLTKLAPYSAAIVCPAHEYRFWGLAARLRQLEETVTARTGHVEAIILEDHPDTVWKIAQRMTWSRGWEGLAGMDRRLAVAEAASHVERLHHIHGLRTLPPTRPASLPSMP